VEEDLRVPLLHSDEHRDDNMNDFVEGDDESIVCAKHMHIGNYNDDFDYRRMVTIFVGNTAFAAPREPGDPTDVEWFEWTCFVRPKHHTDIHLIESIAFTLHPTFCPHRVVVDAAAACADDGRFAVSRRGWCAFPVGVEVTDCHGHVHYFSHDLCFQRRSEDATAGGTRRRESLFRRRQKETGIAVIGVEYFFEIEKKMDRWTCDRPKKVDLDRRE
jgi:transcription initiation factor IIF auxiliary subunit